MLDVPSIAPGLKLGADCIWHSESPEPVSYPVDGNAACFEIEEASFWFAHRADCIVAAVRRFPPPDGATILDVGGGNGYVAAALIEAGFEAALLEPGAAGAAAATARGVPCVIRATVDTAGFRPNVLDAVGLFDVIEHIEDDRSFLKSVRATLKDGAFLYATVPAYDALWSAADARAGHFRRYSAKTICAAAASAGFEIAFASYVFRPLPASDITFPGDSVQAQCFRRAGPGHVAGPRAKTGPRTADVDVAAPA